jgi:hypothetical protein
VYPGAVWSIPATGFILTILFSNTVQANGLECPALYLFTIDGMQVNEHHKMAVSIVLIPHNNEQKFQTRLGRDIIPTIQAHPDWDFQVIIVDNSDPESRVSLQSLYELNICPVYLWPGKNIMYGPAMNLALQARPYPYIVYMCTNHGRMYNTSWIDDLVMPIKENPGIAMTGSYYNSCPPAALGFPAHLRPVHIQGGIFAANTAVMQQYPYTADERYIHWGSDVVQSFQLLNAGFSLYNVPTIKSVWRQKLVAPEQWKYVHDNSED